MSLIPDSLKQRWTLWRRRYHMQHAARAAGRSAAAGGHSFAGWLNLPGRFARLARWRSPLGANALLSLLVALAAFLFILGGAVAIVWHAQRLYALQARLALEAGMVPLGRVSTSAPAGAADPAQKAAADFAPDLSVNLPRHLQSVLPGMRFRVPQQSGVSWVSQPGGSLWIMAGMRAAPPVLVDLCRQQADARHLIPLHIGWRFADVQQAVASNRARGLPDGFGLKSVIISDERRDPLAPRLELSAMLVPGQRPNWQLRVPGGAASAGRPGSGDVPMLLSDANPAQVLPLLPNQAQAMKQQAWVQWGNGSTQRALHLSQRQAASCPLGQLQVQWFEPGSGSTQARVQAFGWQQGALPVMSLAPGAYEVPETTGAVLEDQQLFEASLQARLIWLKPDGQIALAERNGVRTRLLKRLYFDLDGAYVRQQIQLFNREQPGGVRAGDLAYRHIRLEKNANGATQLQWHPVRKGGFATRQAPGAVTLLDRHDQLLWRGGQSSSAALAAGLAPLLGDEDKTGHGVPAVLARAWAGQTVTAQLTLDLGWQRLLTQIVDCVGMQGGKWDGQTCHAVPGAATPPAGRRAAMLLLDADSGEILASSQAGPAARPLLGWQHDGGNFASPGSTFKLVTALALEQVASPQPALQARLAGLPLAQLNQLGSKNSFRTDAACYPMPCAGRQPHVSNYRDHILQGRAGDGRFGLAQALSSSMNTWFAWQAEAMDATLLGSAQGGMPDLQPLQPGGLDGLRPMLAVSRKLGFEQPVRLDGGWLPAGFAMQAGDALLGSVSRLEPVHSRHELRQQAIGLRMQTHVLQMAQVSAAIASGGVRAPTLLRSVQKATGTSGINASSGISATSPLQAQYGTVIPLAMPLARIRSGMQGVVQTGTAAKAFAAPAFNAIRPWLYGKTGTAPVGDELNSAWFVGYLDASAMPAQAPLRASLPAPVRRLAFAASISHTELTGGAHAAPMVAAFLASLPAHPAVK